MVITFMILATHTDIYSHGHTNIVMWEVVYILQSYKALVCVWNTHKSCQTNYSTAINHDMPGCKNHIITEF